MSNAADDADDFADDELGDGDELPEVIHVTDDLDEYVEKERYKAIFRAKQEAAETLRTYGNPAAIADSPAQLQVIRETVSGEVVSYITEIRRILEETEPGKELWSGTRIDTLPVGNATALDGNVADVTPTTGLSPVAHTPTQTRNNNRRTRLKADDDGNLQPSERILVKPDGNGGYQPFDPTPRNNRNPDFYYVIDGVADYLELHDTEANAEYLTDAPGLNRGQKRETVAIDPYPPVSLSRDVYQRLTRLLTETGLDVELGEPGDDVADGDYSDIL